MVAIEISIVVREGFHGRFRQYIIIVALIGSGSCIHADTNQFPSENLTFTHPWGYWARSHALNSCSGFFQLIVVVVVTNALLRVSVLFA
jgi:hypothetical protein